MGSAHLVFFGGGTIRTLGGPLSNPGAWGCLPGFERHPQGSRAPPGVREGAPQGFERGPPSWGAPIRTLEPPGFEGGPPGINSSIPENQIPIPEESNPYSREPALECERWNPPPNRTTISAAVEIGKLGAIAVTGVVVAISVIAAICAFDRIVRVVQLA